MVTRSNSSEAAPASAPPAPPPPSTPPSPDDAALGNTGAPEPSGAPSGRLYDGSLVLVLPVLLLVAGVLFYYLVGNLRLIPLTYDLELRLFLVAALGYLAVFLVGSIVRRIAHRWAGPHRGGLIVSVYRVVAYTALVVAVLLVWGINSLALLAGGTFAGLVIGLAGQTVLSNVMAGVFLLFVRPFEPGDRITVTTWQYGLLAPVYPPKFYSQDTLIPGYTGVVTDIGIAYTEMRLDEGTTFRVPNSVLIQAAVVSHELTERWVRLKYEVPPSVDPVRLLVRLADLVKASKWVTKPESVRVLVNQATMNSYIISVDAVCSGSAEEPPRSALLLLTMRVVREMQAQVASGDARTK